MTIKFSNIAFWLGVKVETKSSFMCWISIDFSKSTSGTKGYFDVTTGDLKINCDFDETYEFSEGYAAVKKESLAGIIDEDGKTIVDFKYTETRSVHSNSAFVMKDGKWGILKIEK